MKIIKCVGCSSKVAVTKSYLSVVEEESGYKGIVDVRCNVNWICPSCYNKVEGLAKEIVKLMNGNSNVVLSRLIEKSH